MSRVSPVSLFLILALSVYGTDVVVNSVPGDARFVNYAIIDWRGITITPETLKEFGDAVSKATRQGSEIASNAGADLVVLITPESGVIVPSSISGAEIRLRKKDPVLVAVFYKMKPGRKVPRESAVRFTTTPFPETEGVSVDFKITRTVDTAGVTLSYWVYMNLPRFVTEANLRKFDTITIKSSDDPDSEEVWLPGCDVPLRVSKKKPVIECSIYKRKANQAAQTTPGLRPSVSDL